MNFKAKLLFFFSCMVFAMQAQERTSGSLIQFNIGDKFEPAEVTYTDGSKQKGYLNGFIENNTIDFGSYNNFDNFEGQLNLDDKKFYFKTDLNAKPTTLTQNDVKEISIIGNAWVKTYRLLNIKTVGKNNELLDLERKAWLPLLLKDEFVNLYGFNMYINNRYVHTYVYISNDNIDAFKPTEKTFAGMETMIQSHKTVFKYIFKDCESVNPMIDEFVKVDNWKTEKKTTDAQIKAVRKDKSLTDAQQEQQIMALNQKYFTDPYSKIIDEYKKSCNP